MGEELGETSSDNFYISKNYEDSLDVVTKKAKGIYYTPKKIVDYIIKKTIRSHDVVKNPYPKILDISCGCGNFLLEVYDVLYELFEENIYELKIKYDDKYWKTDNIHNHIISNCIYGCDIDSDAIDILIRSLKNKDKDLKVEKINIECVDSLIKEFNNEFDYIIGNPPYVGQKSLNNKYKKILLEKYFKVYKGKSDLYFCFYQKIIDLLKKDGIGSVITPRYFLESPSGIDLRHYVNENVLIDEIVDFSGANIFKNIGVSSCIFTFKKEHKVNNYIDIFKLKGENLNISKDKDLEYYLESKCFENFKLKQSNLRDEWIIVNEDDRKFYENINSKCSYILEDICTSFQGIITGCDKAFVIKNDNKDLKKINQNLLKPWVKNKNICKYIVEDSKFNLIYSNDIDDEENYSFELNNYIGNYKDKLLNRRECIKNIRKWYELQWGRDKGLFERQKIMYPYKSMENRFAIDYKNRYCSADVYSFFIKDEYLNEFSHEYLVGILNSDIYDKYFKITAKKMSKKIYDYYPNKVMKMKIFKDYNYSKIEFLSKEIINLLNKKYKNENDNNNVVKLQNEINKLIEKSLFL